MVWIACYEPITDDVIYNSPGIILYYNINYYLFIFYFAINGVCIFMKI